MNRLIRAFSASALFILAATAGSSADPVLPVAAAPEDVGLSSSQLARIEAVTRKYVDSGLVPGAVMLVARRGKIAWTQDAGLPGPRRKGPDAAGFDLPHLFHDQADRLRCGHDAGRGRQDAGQRSRLEIFAGNRPHEGGRRDSGRRASHRWIDRSRPGDDGSGPDAAHIWADLRFARQLTRQRGLYRCQDRQPRREPGRVRHQGVETAAALLARGALGVRHFDRRAGPGRRGRLGKDAWRVPQRTHSDAARHDRYRLLRAARQAAIARRSPGRCRKRRR